MISGPKLREGLVAAGRGVALTGLILAEVGVLVALAIAVTLAALGFGLLLIPDTLLAGRGLTNRIRRLAGEWSGVSIAVPYRPQPTGDAARPGLWRRLAWLLTDQATWRDLLWMTVDGVAGWLLTLAPVALIAWGLFGVVMPAVWAPIARCPAEATGTPSFTSPAPPRPGYRCSSARPSSRSACGRGRGC